MVNEGTFDSTPGQPDPDPGDPDPGDPAAIGPDADWPQLGRDPQRTNASKVQVDAPYCVAWKWYQVPLSGRSQPVVGNGVLYMGSMNGKLYARDARTGAPKWEFAADGPIRHTAGVLVGSVVGGNGLVVFSTYNGLNGSTYALDAATGAQKWKRETGPSATAPLLHPSRLWAYVASTNGKLTALDIKTGEQKWQKDFGAPLLTTPSLSNDGNTVFLGAEDIRALAVDAGTGATKWQTKLPGQSLGERYPVVINNAVVYRSQPLHYFHHLLQGWGDDVMDAAGEVGGSLEADWVKVKPKIVNHLTANPDQQSFFVLNASDGKSRGVAPVLYTYGVQEVANTPVYANGATYVTYRARKGIQTDSKTVHVSTKYDAELGNMNLSSLDVTGLKGDKISGLPQWRMTSDEPAMLTMGGNLLWVDNWERFGAMNVKTGAHVHGGAIGNPVDGCNEYCGGSDKPFFPLTGNGPSYPFPAVIKGEGDSRGGVVIASGMVYWRILGAGLMAIRSQSGGTCNTAVYGPTQDAVPPIPLPPAPTTTRALDDYVTTDLTAPATNPPADLVERLRNEIRTIVNSGGHLMPYYLERGFSSTKLWPAGSPTSSDTVPSISFQSHGTAFWHDPGELLYTLAMAYPYLDASLQQQTKAYVADEIKRYSPLEKLPYNNKEADWMRTGVARELYNVPMRSKLNNWPTANVSLPVFYGLWLWAKNTGDWSYACANSSAIKSLYDGLKGNVRYYADLAGLIGYARLSQGLSQRSCAGWSSSDAASAQSNAVEMLRVGQDYGPFMTRARTDYLDPRSKDTGWSLPELNGLVPEMGLFISEQTAGAARNEVAGKQTAAGLRWWWFTRGGIHAEVGETAFLAPNTAWTHFLARAYVIKDSQADLRKWLDYAWGKGDLYAIQKLVATIQAP
jgi:outer membrane protein assembly factor BamB